MNNTKVLINFVNYGAKIVFKFKSKKSKFKSDLQLVVAKEIAFKMKGIYIWAKADLMIPAQPLAEAKRQ